MAVLRQRFYVGILNDRPAYLAHTRNSITCELFCDYATARRKFDRVARLEIEPCIKVTNDPKETFTPRWWEERPSAQHIVIKTPWRTRMAQQWRAKVAQIKAFCGNFRK